MNIKTIGYGELEDFLVGHGKKLSSKTISMEGCLHDFFNWLVQREVIQTAPNFPSVKVKLSYRQTVGKETQGAC